MLRRVVTVARIPSTPLAAAPARRTLATSSKPLADRDPVIVSFARTPIGKFNGALASLTAPQLGAVAIKAAVARAGIQGEDVQEVLMGNVVSAAIGQAPARQASMFAGLPVKTIATTVNKVCASGMKALMLASQSIMLGHAEVIVAGGMESMSNIPYYLPKARSGYRLGHGQLVDGVIFDGLWDPYNNQHMGLCAEKCAKDYKISREAQDAFALLSYTRTKAAVEGGLFKEEIAPVTIKGRKGEEVVVNDEQYTSMDPKKLSSLTPAFMKEGGVVTAGNASSLNDGAAAFVLMSAGRAKAMGLTPLARILGFGDAEQAPVDFTTAPSLAVPVALGRAGLTLKDVDLHEVNEAFAVVALANAQLLGVEEGRMNVNGGAVGLGHPIGMSGARIVGSLMTGLKQRKEGGRVGVASICNGGGGASAVVIEML